MPKLGCLFVLLSCCCLLAWAEPRLQQQQLQQQLKLKQFNQMSSNQHPYLFLTIPRGRANAGAVVQGFEIVEEPEDDDDDNDIDDQLDMAHNDDVDDADDADDEDAALDDDEGEESHMSRQHNKFARHGQLVFLNAANPDQDLDDDDDDEEPAVASLRKAQIQQPATRSQAKLTQAKPTQMMVARDQAGAIMVPDGIIEIEGQSVVDEKTGKAALLVPRAALDAIPDGAVVALMERSALIDATNNNGDREEERANRVTVRRRKTGGRRNVRLRRRGTNNRRRRVSGGNRRRRGGNASNRRRNVRVIRPGRNGGNGQRRRRRNGQVVLQG